MQAMEVGSKALREVEFRQQLRGYHQDDVDKFLEEVAAGIEVLQDRLREANERASRAEMLGTADRAATTAPERPPPSLTASGEDADDAVRRTLELAHRTMTLAIGEAKDEARRLVAEAEARAAEIVGAAEASADRRMIAGRNELRDELARLTAARAELEGEVSELEETAQLSLAEIRDTLRRALDLLESNPSGRQGRNNGGVSGTEGKVEGEEDRDGDSPVASSSTGHPGGGEPIHAQHGRVRVGQGVAPEPAEIAPPGPTPRGWTGSASTSPPGSAPPGTPPSGTLPGPSSASTWPVGWRSTSASRGPSRGGDGMRGEALTGEHDRDDPAATRLNRLGPSGSLRNRLYDADAEQAES